MSAPASVSVIVPALNEQATIAACLARVLDQPFVAEVIVVDDGSEDNTAAIVAGFEDSRVRLLSHRVNRGKGASIRTAVPLCTAAFIAIQDADLEYDPVDLGRLLGPLESGEADVVYGSRFLPTGARRALYFWHSMGNKALTLACNMASNLNLTDMETCYKVFRRECLQSLVLEEDRFGIEPELTIKAAAAGFAVYEVGISYHGRTYDEGKKIGWKDGVSAIRCIVKYGVVENRRKGRKRRLQAPPHEQSRELQESLEDLKGVDNYYDWIVDLVEPYLGDRVLEVGAGVGTVSSRIGLRGRTVVAIEPDPRAFSELDDWARATPPHQAYSGTLSEASPSLNGDFSSAVMVNVLEHIDNEVAELGLIRDHLRPGGHIAIWVPAHEALFARFDESVGHYRRYNKRRLAALADMAGLEVVELRYLNPVGAIGWMLTAKALRATPTDSALAGIFDKYVVPVTKRVESRWEQRFGQSVLLIARKPLTE